MKFYISNILFIITAISFAQTETVSLSNTIGAVSYESKDHRSNVYEIVNDRKVLKSNQYHGVILAATDYYPYGSEIGARSFNGEYKYGFQGQEKDEEVKGKGNSINYKYRMHDARVGRFFSVDPLASDYPYNSSYAFSENVMINAIELEGLEKNECYNFKKKPFPKLRIAYSKLIEKIRKKLINTSKINIQKPPKKFLNKETKEINIIYQNQKSDINKDYKKTIKLPENSKITLDAEDVPDEFTLKNKDGDVIYNKTLGRNIGEGPDTVLLTKLDEITLEVKLNENNDGSIFSYQIIVQDPLRIQEIQIGTKKTLYNINKGIDGRSRYSDERYVYKKLKKQKNILTKRQLKKYLRKNGSSYKDYKNQTQ